MFVPLKHIQAIKQALKEKNIPFHMTEEIDHSLKKGHQWECEIEGTIDDVVMRAISKIAFNYLAFWQGADFVLHQDFNIIRDYILKGNKPDYPLVRIIENPILGDEPVVGKRRLGHIVTTNWAADKVSVVSQISLFNWITYNVCLVRKFSGKHKDIKKGHFFNFNTRDILELGTNKND